MAAKIALARRAARPRLFAVPRGRFIAETPSPRRRERAPRRRRRRGRAAPKRPEREAALTARDPTPAAVLVSWLPLGMGDPRHTGERCHASPREEERRQSTAGRPLFTIASHRVFDLLRRLENQQDGGRLDPGVDGDARRLARGARPDRLDRVDAGGERLDDEPSVGGARRLAMHAASRRQHARRREGGETRARNPLGRMVRRDPGGASTLLTDVVGCRFRAITFYAGPRDGAISRSRPPASGIA